MKYKHHPFTGYPDLTEEYHFNTRLKQCYSDLVLRWDLETGQPLPDKVYEDPGCTQEVHQGNGITYSPERPLKHPMYDFPPKFQIKDPEEEKQTAGFYGPITQHPDGIEPFKTPWQPLPKNPVPWRLVLLYESGFYYIGMWSPFVRKFLSAEGAKELNPICYMEIPDAPQFPIASDAAIAA